MNTKKERCEKTETLKFGTKLLKAEELLQIRGGFGNTGVIGELI